MKKILCFVFLILFVFFDIGSAYVIWLKSFDNTIINILQIESDNNMNIPIVSLIFDGTGEKLNNFWDEYDTFSGAMQSKILHITLSPNHLTAEDIVNGKFDSGYIYIFENIKKYNIKVMFRTMHEMNGWRYPRWSNPYRFKKARIHVYELSRSVWLDKNNILFDRSVNHRDMRTPDKIPSQKSPLYRCISSKKSKSYCPKLEDYYPWNGYVDLVWFTFYNRGKAGYDRQRLTAKQILNDDDFIIRISKLGKPLIVDEFATTAVYYDKDYDRKLSQSSYKNDLSKKNKRLKETAEYLATKKNIIWAIYFNVDYTNGLTNWMVGEADRAIINTQNKKIYDWRKNLYDNSIQADNIYYMFETGTKLDSLKFIIQSRNM